MGILNIAGIRTVMASVVVWWCLEDRLGMPALSAIVLQRILCTQQIVLSRYRSPQYWV